MKLLYLFPAVFRKMGWILLAIAVALGIYAIVGINTDKIDLVRNNDLLLNISLVGMLLACLFIFFSKNKNAQEFTYKLRCEAFFEALFVNTCLLIVLLLFLLSSWNIIYLLYTNLFSLFLLQFIIYNLKLSKNKNKA